MERLFPLCFVLAIALILAGCAPEESLFPLFTNTEKLLDEKLLGESRIWSGKDAQVDDKPGHIVFSPSDYGDHYEVKLTEFNAEGGSWCRKRIWSNSPITCLSISKHRI